MKAEVKTLWVEALRSGEFNQTRGVLHRVEGEEEVHSFCCLGVLCEIAVTQGVEVVTSSHALHGVGELAISYAGCDAYLPAVVQEWAGLNSTIGHVGHLSRGVNLVNLNDAGRSFAEIADVIEAHA